MADIARIHVCEKIQHIQAARGRLKAEAMFQTASAAKAGYHIK